MGEANLVVPLVEPIPIISSMDDGTKESVRPEMGCPVGAITTQSHARTEEEAMHLDASLVLLPDKAADGWTPVSDVLQLAITEEMARSAEDTPELGPTVQEPEADVVEADVTTRATCMQERMQSGCVPDAGAMASVHRE